MFSWQANREWVCPMRISSFRIAVAAAVTAAFALRLATVPHYVESLDGWFFVRGVERYSVVVMRPHWPGYPLYILLGRALGLVTQDAARALHLLSVLASSLTAWPLMVLARDWCHDLPADSFAAERSGVAAGVLWALAPLSWLTGTEILSEPPALLVALLVLACSDRVLRSEHRSQPWLLTGAVLAGLMLGIRLAYLPLVLPLAYTALVRQARGVRIRPVPAWALAFALMAVVVASWLLWQLAADGLGFVEAARQRLSEHFGSWGRRVVAGGHWWKRPLWFLATFARQSLGDGWTPSVGITAAVLVGVPVLLGSMRLARHPDRGTRALVLLFAGPYVLWILAANDVSLPRHSLALLALACIAAGLGLPRGWPGLALAGGAGVALLTVTLPLALARRADPPVAHRLAEYVAHDLDPRRTTILVTPDVAWVSVFLEELAPGHHAQSVTVADLNDTAERLEGRGWTVYSTSPPREAPQEWAPVAHFTRRLVTDARGPRELWLYRHLSPGVTPGP